MLREATSQKFRPQNSEFRINNNEKKANDCSTSLCCNKKPLTSNLSPLQGGGHSAWGGGHSEFFCGGGRRFLGGFLRRGPRSEVLSTKPPVAWFQSAAEVGSSSKTSNDSPRAPPRCGGAPAAVRTHPEHAPDGPDTGGHRPGPPGRAPGVNGHGAPTATTSQHHSLNCSKRQ